MPSILVCCTHFGYLFINEKKRNERIESKWFRWKECVAVHLSYCAAVVFSFNIKLQLGSSTCFQTTLNILTKFEASLDLWNMKTDVNLTNSENVYPKCYYRAFEVLCHIKIDDFWVILNRRVLDLSNLMKAMDEMPSNGKDLTVCLWNRFVFVARSVSEWFLKCPLQYYLHCNCRHYINWICSVEPTSANCLKSGQEINWKCLNWNRTVNMERARTCSGGMIQPALSAALQLENVTFVYGTRLKVIFSHINSTIIQAIKTTICNCLQVLSAMWRFVKKIPSMKFGPNISVSIQIKIATILFGVKPNRL